jgi:hypothetical protein
LDFTRENCRRRRFTVDGEPSIHVVQALVPERKTVLGRDGIEPSAASVSLLPTDFEEISKVRIHCIG